MDTAPVAVTLPSVASNVIGNVDDILTSIAALSLSVDDAQRLITAIHSSAAPIGAEDGGTSATDALGVDAPPAVPGGALASKPVATPTVVTAALAAAPAIDPDAPAAVVTAVANIPAVDPAASTAVATAAPLTSPNPAAIVITAPVAPALDAIPAAAVPDAPAPPLPAQPANPVAPVVPANHFTLSRHGVLYLVPLQDVPGPYYAVTKGKSIGVIAGWNCASPLVTGIKGAIFRRVSSIDQGMQAIMSAIDDNIVEYL